MSARPASGQGGTRAGRLSQARAAGSTGLPLRADAAAPVKVLTENGRAKAIECVRMRLGDKDASGRRRPVPGR